MKASPTKVQSMTALMVKDYQLKVSINVQVTGAAPESGAASDPQINLGRELLPLDLNCLVFC